MFGLRECATLIILITTTAMMGCASTEPPRSLVFERINVTNKKHKAYVIMEHGLIADDINSKTLTSDESKIIFFRKKKISTAQVFISINGYALVGVSAGQSFSLKIPAKRQINIGSGMLDAIGKGIGITSDITLLPEAKRTYYYAIQSGWRKSIIEQISKEEAMNYLDSGYLIGTPSYNIDWDVFLNIDKNYSPRFKSLNKNGSMFAPRHDINEDRMSRSYIEKNLCIDLYYGSFFGNTSLVRRLLAANVEINTCFYNKETPLSAATRAGYAEIVRMLLDAGAKPNADLR